MLMMIFNVFIQQRFPFSFKNYKGIKECDNKLTKILKILLETGMANCS